MRLIKMFGLAAMAAVAAMAFVGATSASAAPTALCNTSAHETVELVIDKDSEDIIIHEACPEGELSAGVAMNNEGQGVGTLLTDLVNVLCLTISGAGTALGLANPQQIHITSLSFTNCGTKSAHSNCQVSVLELPLANLNKTGLDAGTITGTNGLTLVNCDNIDIFGIDIHCVYDATGLTFNVGAQLLHANDTSVNFVEGGGLCPEESFLDGLLHTADYDPAPADTGDTANRYVLS